MKQIISWDLGKTKCAAAHVKYDAISNQFHIEKECAIFLRDVTSLETLVQTIEQHLGIQMRDANAICIGAAGQYDGEVLHHTNPYPFPMLFKKVATENSWPTFQVVHDYTPILCATFTDYINKPHYIKWLHRGTMDPYGRRVTLGVGTGLGVKDGILLSDQNFWFGTNEMGHIGVCLPPLTQPDFVSRHNDLMHYLRAEKILAKHEPLTFEKILSGDGLERLYQFTTSKQPISAGTISDLLKTGQAQDTLAMFAWYLGLFIGTVQLTFMPTGGIWIAGGVALNNLLAFDHPHFYQGIHASPAYQAERAIFPMGILMHPHHAFIGAAFFATRKIMTIQS